MQLSSDIDTLAGSITAQRGGREPFSDDAVRFLGQLAAQLRSHPEAKVEPDLAAFAFWCRKSHLEKLRSTYLDEQTRLGHGLAFHISPGNVPINAFYSFAFGLLSGNSNIVRLPSKDSRTTELMVEILNALLTEPEFKEIADTNTFVRYDHSGNGTNEISALCDARIIWGGDETIRKIRQSPLPVRARELTFADRYSFAVINADVIEAMTETALAQLAAGFVNDTLLMDQNACSSPHLLAWLGTCTSAKQRFWRAVSNDARNRYTLEPVQAVDRYTRLLSGFTDLDGQSLISNLSDPIQRVSLAELPEDIDKLRGLYGLFYEFDAPTLDGLAHIVNKKYQTMTYCGVEPSVLADFVKRNRLAGIDRIVPIGKALDMNVIWDGYNVLQELTRIIDVK